MIKIIHDEHADALPNWLCEMEYQDIQRWIKAGNNRTLIRESANIFNRVRAGIAEGEIPHDQIVFVYQGQELRPNEYGALVEWPHGFLDYDIILCERILTAAIKRRQAKRKEQQHEVVS